MDARAAIAPSLAAAEPPRGHRLWGSKGDHLIYQGLALLLFDATGGDQWVVLKEEHSLLLDRRQRIEVVSHHPRRAQMRHGRNNVAAEHQRIVPAVDPDELQSHRV